MKEQFMEAISLRKKTAALFVAFAASCMMAMGMSGVAFAASPSSPDYSLSTYSTGEYDQHVVLSIDYGEEVTLVGDANLQTVDDNIAITIAGRDITSADYKRPVTVSIEDSVLKLDVGNCVDASNAAVFTAQFSGVFTAVGTPQNITIGDEEESPAAIDFKSVSPTGVALTQTSAGNTGSVTYNVSHVANVRGMVHVGVYKEGTDGKLVPLCTDPGNINCYTYVTHAHAFTTLTAANYASAIAGFELPAGYEITANGSSFTLTGPENENLYVYIFDDTTLSELGDTFQNILNTGKGELNPDGSAKN